MRIALMLLAIVFGVGCSATPAPSARVDRAGVAERTDQGVRVEFVLALENQTDTPLPIRETRYRVELGGLPDTFTFTDRTVATIPARGSQNLTLPAAFEIPRGEAQGPASSRPYRITGEVVYEAPGEFRRLLTESGIPLPSVNFAATGQLEK